MPDVDGRAKRGTGEQAGWIAGTKVFTQTSKKVGFSLAWAVARRFALIFALGYGRLAQFGAAASASFCAVIVGKMREKMTKLSQARGLDGRAWASAMADAGPGTKRTKRMTRFSFQVYLSL